jgi:hypothetical protein
LHLRGKFFDVSELEPLVQLVPVAVDVDIVSEIRKQHPAGAFKTKVLDPKQLDVIYDATDSYYIEFTAQVPVRQEERTLIRRQVFNTHDFKVRCSHELQTLLDCVEALWQLQVLLETDYSEDEKDIHSLLHQLY